MSRQSWRHWDNEWLQNPLHVSLPNSGSHRLRIFNNTYIYITYATKQVNEPGVIGDLEDKSFQLVYMMYMCWLPNEQTTVLRPFDPG